jgi:hypothetical protein
MMMAMMSRPPERTTLHRHATDPREDELDQTPGLERAMREIAMIEPRDGEHAHQIGDERDHHGHRVQPTQITARQARVHAEERNAARPVDPIG